MLQTGRRLKRLKMQSRPGRRSHGAAMTELLVTMLGLAPLTLGGMQAGLVYNAKSVVNYATFEAAREGAVANARRGVMESTLARHLVPLYGGGRNSTDLVKSYAKARLDVEMPAVPFTDGGSGTRLEIISPSKEVFDDFGKDIDGKTQLPNEHLKYKGRDVGTNSGVNIQDANLLKIKVTYGYKLFVPVVNKIIGKMMATIDKDNASYYLADPPRLPIVAMATVRMQSNAYVDDNETDPGAGGGGSVPGGGDPGDTGTPPDPTGDDDIVGPIDCDDPSLCCIDQKGDQS